MRHHRLAWGAFVVTAGLCAADLYLLLTPPPGYAPALADTINSVFSLLGALLIVVVGALVAARLPRNPIGWLLGAIGLALGLSSFGSAYAQTAYWTGTEQLPGGWFAAWLSMWTWLLPYLGLLAILYLFPTGTFLTPRWRASGIASLVVFTVVIFSFMLNSTTTEPSQNGTVAIRNPIGLLPFSDAQAILVFAGLVCIIVLALAGMLARFMRARGIERQQMKWFLYAAAVLVSSMVLSALFPNSLLGNLVSIVALGLPLSVAIAILRYRLYDVDIIIRRTLTYALVTLLLLAAYFLSVILLQQVFSALTGSRQNDIVTVLSTLAIAALFIPVRNRVQRAVDRRFYRSKYDAQQVLLHFGERMRDETDLDALTNELVNVVHETMQPRSVSLWLKKKE